jgi:hypothetical protein
MRIKKLKEKDELGKQPMPNRDFEPMSELNQQKKEV